MGWGGGGVPDFWRSFPNGPKFGVDLAAEIGRGGAWPLLLLGLLCRVRVPEGVGGVVELEFRGRVEYPVGVYEGWLETWFW